MAPTEDIRAKFGRFRILVVGRANAGKTTLLQRVCNTIEKPEIFDREGKKIDATVVQGSVNRGYHNIENELVFGSNRDFIFHDSCGFEAGGEAEFKDMKKFVLERASTTKLKERVHAIWYCIPMDEYSRAITKAEERFFSECNTSSVPVIAVFTKFDALWVKAYGQLKKLGLTRVECKRMAPDRAKEIFADMKIWDRLRDTRYPPKDFVYLAEMDKEKADCGPLLDGTTGALGEEAMQMLLITTQQTNLELCMKYAVKWVLVGYIKKARTIRGSLWLSNDTCAEMQLDIASWFPHVEWLRLWLRLGDDDGLLQDGRLDLLLDSDLLTGIETIAESEVTLGSYQPSTTRLFNTLTPTIQLGIAIILILEYSFFLSQQGNQESGKFTELAAAEYTKTKTATVVEKAVKDILRQDDGDDDKLCDMIIDIILQNRMSKVLEE